jgi:cell wall assembly regulator SMI1
MAQFSNLEAPITISQIEEIENEVGLNFPENYKNHLLKYNGGQCDPNNFYFDENGILNQSSLDWFLAIYDGEFDNLKSYIQIYKEDEKRMPYHIIPIAHDPGGNLICLSCGVIDYGYIYFWDHEKEVDYSESDDSDYSNLILIANDINDFLERLF